MRKYISLDALFENPDWQGGHDLSEDFKNGMESVIEYAENLPLIEVDPEAGDYIRDGRVEHAEKEETMKKILDVTCGSRTIWFNKHHPAVIYCDKRQEVCSNVWKSTKGQSERLCIVDPDVVCDFTDLPFPDESFVLVVFDPPQLRHVGENAWMRKKYGSLDDGWQQMLHDGYRECMRVLKPDGVLIFKWSEVQIPAQKVWGAIGEKPLFGHHSGKKMNTFWCVFMKLQEEQAE